MRFRVLTSIAVAVHFVTFSDTTSAPAYAAAPKEASAASAADVEEVVAEIKDLYHEAQKKLEELPEERFDRTWVLEQADYKVGGIVDWVEQNTRWVPYQGVLRGADGVLLDRQGNSLDRSLLFSALLEDAGYETRLANGQLSKSAVEFLLREIDSGLVTPRSLASYSSPEAQAAVGRAAEQAAALVGMVELSDAPWSTDLGTGVADHWWVEAKLESGWSSLDPLLSSFPELDRPEASQRYSADDLPHQLFHRVTIRVVIERWDRGRVSEETPLAHTLRAAAGTAQDLELRFIPFGFTTAPEGSDAQAEILAVAGTTQDWLPLFRIGKQRVRQQGFGVDGQLERNPDRPAVDRKMEGATSALADLGRNEERPASVLTACWIEYQADVPGREPLVVRRELFDLIGPAQRRNGDLASFTIDPEANSGRGLALQGTSRILVTSSALPVIVLEKAALELWARQGPQVAAFVRLLDDPVAAEPLQRLLREPMIPLDLLSLAVVRGELSRFREVTFQALPNIWTTHVVPEMGAELEFIHAVDIVINDVGVMANSIRPTAEIRLEQGVLDTVLEAALARGEGPSRNTAELFARRGELAGDWVRLGKNSQKSSLSAEARARTAAAVAAGRTVVAPQRMEKGAEPAWWEIDPTTGTTLGIGFKGWGTEITERTIQEVVPGEGTRRGAAALSRRQTCALLWAFLKSTNMVTPVGPGFLWSIEAYTMAVERGCI